MSNPFGSVTFVNRSNASYSYFVSTLRPPTSCNVLIRRFSGS
ncbi:hypothetical protein [Lysobacter gummosus]